MVREDSCFGGREEYSRGWVLGFHWVQEDAVRRLSLLVLFTALSLYLEHCSSPHFPQSLRFLLYVGKGVGPEGFF